MFTYEVKADTEKNVLCLRLSGFANTNEINSGIKAIIYEANKLSKGFDLINDISEFFPTAKKDTELIKELQSELIKIGLRKVVRIVNQSVIANMQLKQVASEVGYTALTANNKEEAYIVLGKN